MAKRKISRTLSAITWVLMILAFAGILAGTEPRFIIWAHYDKNANHSSTVPTSINIPSGQILSKGLLLDQLGKETWPHSQTKLIDRKNMVDLLCQAAVHYRNNQTYIQA